jgi:large subunit ribosomal protein L32
MAVPKYRISASKRDMRRSHHALKSPGASKCSNCGTQGHPHQVCASCGFYRGKQVMKVKSTMAAGADLDFTK